MNEHLIRKWDDPVPDPQQELDDKMINIIVGRLIRNGVIPQEAYTYKTEFIRQTLDIWAKLERGYPASDYTHDLLAQHGAEISIQEILKTEYFPTDKPRHAVSNILKAAETYWMGIVESLDCEELIDPVSGSVEYKTDGFSITLPSEHSDPVKAMKDCETAIALDHSNPWHRIRKIYLLDKIGAGATMESVMSQYREWLDSSVSNPKDRRIVRFEFYYAPLIPWERYHSIGDYEKAFGEINQFCQDAIDAWKVRQVRTNAGIGSHRQIGKGYIHRDYFSEWLPEIIRFVKGSEEEVSVGLLSQVKSVILRIRQRMMLFPKLPNIS